MATIFLVAHDRAPTAAFELLRERFAKEGHVVLDALLDGDASRMPHEGALESGIENADIVIVGMSTPEKNADVELRAASRANALGKPFGFYADAHGVFTRRHFATFGESASFLFVVNESELKRAKRLFPVAGNLGNIFPTGNPVWAEYFQPADKGLARTLLGSRGEEEFIVLFPGDKNGAYNVTTLGAVIESVAMMEGNFHRAVIFAPHPRDPTPHCVYEEIIALGNKLAVRVAISGEKTDEILVGANVVVNGVSVQVNAFAKGVPVIEYYSPLGQAFNESEMGSTRRAFADSGALIPIYSGIPSELADAFGNVRRSPLHLQEAQRRVMPVAKQEEVLDRMMRAVRKILG